MFWKKGEQIYPNDILCEKFYCKFRHGLKLIIKPYSVIKYFRKNLH